MLERNSKLFGTAVLAAALVAGCGGGGGGSAEASTDISASLSALLDYVNNLIASVGENGDQVDVNALTLVVDDSAEPAAL